MRRVFGGAREKVPEPTIGETTEKLGARGDTIDEKIRKLDDQLCRMRDQIKRSRPGPSKAAIEKRALQVLRQKRLYEGQRDQLFNQQFNLEQVAFTTESVQDTANTVKALKGAAKELKTQMKKSEYDIDKIDKLQDEMTDLMDMQNEMQEALGRTYNVPDELDESDLMDELDALESDMALESANEQSTGPSYLQDVDVLPEAPSAAPNQSQSQHAGEVDDFGLPAIPQRN